MNLTKRQAKLVFSLNYEPQTMIGAHPYLTQLLGSFFGYDLRTFENAKKTYPITTYSNTERKDMLKALNWMYAWVDGAGMDSVAGSMFAHYRHSSKRKWSLNFQIYCEHWDEHHQEEISAWAEQDSSTQMTQAFRTMGEIFEQRDEEKENYFDKLAKKVPRSRYQQFLNQVARACNIPSNLHVTYKG